MKYVLFLVLGVAVFLACDSRIESPSKNELEKYIIVYSDTLEKNRDISWLDDSWITVMTEQINKKFKVETELVNETLKEYSEREKTSMQMQEHLSDVATQIKSFKEKYHKFPTFNDLKFYDYASLSKTHVLFRDTIEVFCMFSFKDSFLLYVTCYGNRLRKDCYLDQSGKRYTMEEVFDSPWAKFFDDKK